MRHGIRVICGVEFQLDAIQEQDVKMYIEIERGSEALDQSDCPGRTVLEPVSGFVDQMCRNRPVHDAQHLAHCLRLSANAIWR